MRIVEIRERAVPISRYSDTRIAARPLTTNIVTVISDVMRDSKPVVGYGFASFGRFAQSELIRGRFAPRLLNARSSEVLDERTGTFDPFKCWDVMMMDEKPGGHGDRSVAVGTLDMALWDLAAKIERKPLHRYLADKLERPADPEPEVRVYAGGGYRYPGDDLERLRDEAAHAHGLGYSEMKIKVGGGDVATDINRLELVGSIFGGTEHVAADAMNLYDAPSALNTARDLEHLHLWWLEDIADPLELGTWADVAAIYDHPIAAGEALFSTAEAKLLARFGGLRPNKDVLVFDPVHTYGIPGYLKIVAAMHESGWSPKSFWPHGGHLFSVHLAAAFGLGGSEINPFSFQPFGGLPSSMRVKSGRVTLGSATGIGFEMKDDAHTAFLSLNPADAVPA
jgi:L-alanine-DL-glutamate epimerase-like enolase superfamily enzyme